MNFFKTPVALLGICLIGPNLFASRSSQVYDPNFENRRAVREELLLKMQKRQNFVAVQAAAQEMTNSLSDILSTPSDTSIEIQEQIDDALAVVRNFEQMLRQFSSKAKQRPVHVTFDLGEERDANEEMPPRRTTTRNARFPLTPEANRGRSVSDVLPSPIETVDMSLLLPSYGPLSDDTRVDGIITTEWHPHALTKELLEPATHHATEEQEAYDVKTHVTDWYPSNQ
ncbi:MAG: hypothetical protein LBQ43_04515 [Holosporales bacterium]|jgi:hypothetical protein|nr:hypothetical protein [Holosporales bacterium]